MKNSIWLIFFVLCFRVPAQSQQESLKEKFEATYGQNFKYISDEIKVKGYQQDTYWLIRAVAKSEGFFVIRFQFETLGSAYRYNDYEYHLTIGKNQYLHMRDTVVVPIPIGEHITNFQFLTKSRYDNEPGEVFLGFGNYGLPEPPAYEASLKLTKDKISRSIGELEYMGTRIDSILLANLQIRTSYTAFFKAVRPGKFNIVNKNTGESIPIIIYPADRTVTVLPSRSHGNLYEDHVSSDSGENFFTRTKILRVGDIFSMWVGRGALVLKKEKFSNLPLPRDYEHFDSWIMPLE